MDEICRLGMMAFGKYVKTRKGKSKYLSIVDELTQDLSGDKKKVRGELYLFLVRVEK